VILLIFPLNAQVNVVAKEEYLAKVGFCGVEQHTKGYMAAIAVLTIAGMSKGKVAMKGINKDGQESCRDL